MSGETASPNIGPIFCGICGSSHVPGICVGRIEFRPANTNPAPPQVTTWDLRTPEMRLEAKLDRIIELLEQLVQLSREDE